MGLRGAGVTNASRLQRFAKGLLRVGPIDRRQLRRLQIAGGWTCLKAAEVSSSIFPGFRRDLRTLLLVAGEPVICVGVSIAGDDRLGGGARAPAAADARASTLPAGNRSDDEKRFGAVGNGRG